MDLSLKKMNILITTLIIVLMFVTGIYFSRASKLSSSYYHIGCSKKHGILYVSSELKGRGATIDDDSLRTIWLDLSRALRIEPEHLSIDCSISDYITPLDKGDQILHDDRYDLIDDLFEEYGSNSSNFVFGPDTKILDIIHCLYDLYKDTSTLR